MCFWLILAEGAIRVLSWTGLNSHDVDLNHFCHFSEKLLIISDLHQLITPAYKENTALHWSYHTTLQQQREQTSSCIIVSGLCIETMRHEVKLRITKWSFIIFMKESLEKQNELPPTPWNDSRLTHSFPVGVVHRWDDPSDHNEASRFVQIFSGFFCKQRNKHKKIFFNVLLSKILSAMVQCLQQVGLLTNKYQIYGKVTLS